MFDTRRLKQRFFIQRQKKEWTEGERKRDREEERERERERKRETDIQTERI